MRRFFSRCPRGGDSLAYDTQRTLSVQRHGCMNYLRVRRNRQIGVIPVTGVFPIMVRRYILHIRDRCFAFEMKRLIN
ncbi:hypothetical protein CO2235_210033 [Cupriavidus oxalaticus]|uniref:Uncharacterized protein n=1 Tax=Cupriavidus oxalaticus TaxID=96344 RepID=A0A976BCX6_9BURK|nr:hypothetical protein CO2235_210033 [Cupriavidus oxalaticus]